MSLNGNISGEKPHFYDDYVWKGEALPNATSKTSDAFLGGQTQNALEYVFKASSGAILLGSSGVGVVNSSLKIEVLASNAEAGDFEVVDTPLSIAAGTSKSYAEGDVIAKVVPPSAAGPYLKFRATASGDLSGKKIDAYPEPVNR